jgi:putative ABC transport system permease protein
MFAYYLRLGWSSLKRNPILTTLMVLGIALGVGTSMTTLTVMYLMGSDPIPWKSDKLHIVQVDNWDPAQPYNSDGTPPDQLTYRDAMAFMQAHKADRQTVMYKIQMPVQPENDSIKPFNSLGRATYADFFAMFDPPFKYGGAWDRGQDGQHARVVVLSDKTNEKLFGGADSVGKRVRLNDLDYTVVGVLNTWQPRIKYYDLTNGSLNSPEGFYLPFTTAIELKAGSAGNNSCWNNVTSGWDAYLESECVWLQMWVQTDSAATFADYRAYLDSYVAEQKKLGRFARPLNNRLLNVREWMADQKVVSSDVEVQSGLSLAFLVVCLLNTIGLLLSKFMRKSGEIGLRRALGASRRQIFAQHLVEAGVIGVSGGLIGLLLTFAGLAIVRLLYSDFARVATLDWVMVLMTVALAIVASLLAGLYPTWRACRIVPALQLKTQ